MSVSEPDRIDFLTANEGEDWITLVVADHLPWSPLQVHIDALQGKLNRYLAFVESGELARKQPQYAGRAVIVEVVCKFEPTDEAREFVQYCREVITSAGLGFNFRVRERTD